MDVTERVSAVEQNARALLNERVEVVLELAALDQEVRDLEEALATKQKALALAYSRAERKGWTPEDLRKLGISVSTSRPRGRPRKRSAPLDSAAADVPTGPLERADDDDRHVNGGTAPDNGTKMLVPETSEL